MNTQLREEPHMCSNEAKTVRVLQWNLENECAGRRGLVWSPAMICEIIPYKPIGLMNFCYKHNLKKSYIKRKSDIRNIESLTIKYTS